jgi:hypothetical protein
MNHQRIITHLSVIGDLFHIRQVNDLHFAYLAQLVAPVSLGYSGW